MAREKAKGATTLSSWNEADAALKRIGECEREIRKKEAAATARIEEIKAKLAVDLGPLVGKKNAELHNLEEFAKLHKGEMLDETKGKKSIALNHGSLGFRQSTRIIVRKVERVIELLKAAKRKECIRIKESVDKEALRKLPDDELLDYGVRREVTDEFWCEPADTTVKTGPGRPAA